MKISVILPVYNGARFLGQAVESILSQTRLADEVIVVDDGSTDKTVEVVRQFPSVRCLSKPNGGVASARNFGLTQSQGDLIAFLDQDDHWPKDKLAVQGGLLEQNEPVDFLLAKSAMYLEPGVALPAWVNLEWLGRRPYDHVMGVLMARRRAFEKVGMFNEALAIGSDSDWICRALDGRLCFASISEILLYRRVHAQNHSSDTKTSQRELLWLLRQSVARKRLSSSL